MKSKLKNHFIIIFHGHSARNRIKTKQIQKKKIGSFGIEYNRLKNENINYRNDFSRNPKRTSKKTNKLLDTF
jgi:uncharacterized protein YlaI